MKTSQELRKLILDNVKLVEDAQEILTEMDGEVWNAIISLMKELKKEGGYFEDYDADEDADEQLSLGWGKAYKDRRAYFYLGYEDHTWRAWLGVLGGCYPANRAGLFFYCHQQEHKKNWKNFLSKFYNDHLSLKENGFVLSEDGTELVRYVSLDLNCIAENDPANCLDPLRKAFESISLERNTFDRLVKQADKEFATE